MITQSRAHTQSAHTHEVGSHGVYKHLEDEAGGHGVHHDVEGVIATRQRQRRAEPHERWSEQCTERPDDLQNCEHRRTYRSAWCRPRTSLAYLSHKPVLPGPVLLDPYEVWRARVCVGGVRGGEDGVLTYC
jgi:hypothetical protein